MDEERQPMPHVTRLLSNPLVTERHPDLHMCPVCGGTGLVAKLTGMFTCPTCAGGGLLWHRDEGVREAMAKPVYRVGARVRLVAPSHEVALRGDTGTIIEKGRWCDTWLVELDTPARYRHSDGSYRDLPVILEDQDNMELL